MSHFLDLVGSWGRFFNDDTDDYPLAIYNISGDANHPIVSAVDQHDGEEFVVSGVKWADGVLSFRTQMPSTGRTGQNRFTVRDGVLESEFTFTVRERLSRVEPTQS